MKRRRGPGRPPYNQAQLALLVEVAQKFQAHRDAHGCDVEQAAAELGVCRASMYNYLRKRSLPGVSVLQKAAKLWDLRFVNLAALVDHRRRVKILDERQLTLPFIEALRTGDISVGHLERKASTIEFVVTVRFAGR